MSDEIKRELCCGSTCNAPAGHLCTKDDVDTDAAIKAIAELRAELAAAQWSLQQCMGRLEADPDDFASVMDALTETAAERDAAVAQIDRLNGVIQTERELTAQAQNMWLNEQSIRIAAEAERDELRAVIEAAFQMQISNHPEWEKMARAALCWRRSREVRMTSVLSLEQIRDGLWYQIQGFEGEDKGSYEYDKLYDAYLLLVDVTNKRSEGDEGKEWG